MLALLVVSAMLARADDLEAGEFDFAPNARTLEKGRICLHPLLFDTIVGLGDRVDLKFPGILDLVGGPSLSTEVAVVDAEKFALSVEPSAQTLWTFDRYAAGASAHATVVVGDDRINASVTASWFAYRYDEGFDANEDGTISTDESTHVEGSGVSFPVWLGYDLVTSERTVFNFGTGLLDARGGVDELMLLAAWSHGWESFRISLGATYMPESWWSPQIPDEWEADIGLPRTALPIPHLAMWWRI